MTLPYLIYGGAPMLGVPVLGFPRLGIPGAIVQDTGGGPTWLQHEAELYRQYIELLKREDSEFEELLQSLIKLGVI